MDAPVGTCPLCANVGGRSSWFGTTQYAGRTFTYVECNSCSSLYCHPMPDAALLADMYGPHYAGSFVADPAVDDARDRSRVVAWLRQEPRGRFIDFGCGEGTLLRDVAAIGWDAAGVEFDDDVAAGVAARTGLRVMGRQPAAVEPPADVVHLGDVLEHLTEIDLEMPSILRLIKPGGVLLAQGPLEAHSNLFTWALRAARRLRNAPATMPPYHVMLATAAGQRCLFDRHRLAAIHFGIHEVSWPAPARLAPADVIRPRAVALYSLRKMSQAASRLSGGRWGNRYFYAGRRVA